MFERTVGLEMFTIIYPRSLFYGRNTPICILYKINDAECYSLSISRLSDNITELFRSNRADNLVVLQHNRNDTCNGHCRLPGCNFMKIKLVMRVSYSIIPT